MDIQYDPKTKRFSTKEKEAITAGTESIRVNKALINKLADFAKEDGFDLGGTNQAKSIKRNKAIQLYTEQAITEFIAGRK